MREMRDGEEATEARQRAGDRLDRHTVESTLLVELPPSGLLVLIAMYGWGCCRFAMTAVVGPAFSLIWIGSPK